MNKKKKLIKYYAYFYKTGQLRKVEAESESQAYTIAQGLFGDSVGVYTIGLPLRNGDLKPINGIPLKRS